MTSAIAIVFALGAKKEPVQSTELPHRVKAIEPAGEHFVDITLMTHIHDKAVARRVEHTMERDRQLDHAQVWAEMPARLREHATNSSACSRDRQLDHAQVWAEMPAR